MGSSERQGQRDDHKSAFSFLRTSRSSPIPSSVRGLAETKPIEDGVYVPELAMRVEELIERRRGHDRRNLRIVLKRLAKRPALVPGSQRVGLDQFIGALTVHAGVDQREQHLLRIDQTARQVEIGEHPRIVDNK